MPSKGKNMNDYQVYICPQTQEKLQYDGTKLNTQSKDISYNIKDGIPQFLRYELGETQEIQESLQQLNKIAKAEGWQKALAEVYRDNPGMYSYVTDTKRLILLDLLPLNSESVVLEVGAGLGQFTPEIAKRVKMVHALEVVVEQAEFVRQRCQQQGLSNVQVACGGDDCRFPYANESFDVVICNLVLEWCASRNDDEPILASQQRMLKEIGRVLKSGGVIYLATKNRYSLHYLIGKSDEHCYGMPFGNALPRWLLYSMLRLQGKSRPRGLLHSHDTLRQMLAHQGFGEIKSLWAAPEMRFPLHYIPTDSESIKLARRQPDFVESSMESTNLLLRFIPDSLVKHVTQGLVFLAKKTN
jgi:SAM-dependent methyltransferase/uncharacterized protein YbaR (Trm112 family)